MSRQLTFAVVGHVDHGKTSLVRALTGMETDRLAEEKRRGLTIELGFAYLETPEGVIDFVDAPGHESFVRTMISGASGAAAALLVVDVTQGIQEQTREHLYICRLLGIDRYVVALTKIDRADEEQIATARNNTLELCAREQQSVAQIVPVSSEMGTGVDAVRHALIEVLRETPCTPCGKQPFLPIDRVFVIDGTGVVVTGTLSRGAINTGDEASIWPAGQDCVVRQIEVNGHPATTALPGMRTAISLRGRKVDNLVRGMTLCTASYDRPARQLQVSVAVRDRGCKLRSGDSVRVLFGTTSRIAKIKVVGGHLLQPGESGFMRILFEEPVLARFGQRFVLRRLSPAQTLGGGQILDPCADDRSFLEPRLHEYLCALHSGGLEDALQIMVEAAWPEGVLVSDIEVAYGLQPGATTNVINGAACLGCGGRVYSRCDCDQLEERIEDTINAFHKNSPTLVSMPLNKLMNIIGSDHDRALVALMLKRLQEKSRIVINGAEVMARGFDPFSGLEAPQRERLGKLEAVLLEAGLSPPHIEEISHDLALDGKLLRMLVDLGRIVVLGKAGQQKNIYFHRDALLQASGLLEASFGLSEPFSMSDARKALGVSRKYALPLLEYFDRLGMTHRAGDVRRLIPKKSPV
tara:strand:+ start:98846 stop:100753 length:1908 start_codon:yes stop_codon:yes gene_type:complete